MELFDLQNMMVRNERPKFVIFVGEDYKIANIYIDMISNKFELEQSSLSDLTKLKTLCNSGDVFYSDKAYVMKYPKEGLFSDFDFESLMNELGNNILFIVLNSIDKRLKLYTQNKDYIVNCEPQPEKTFISMVKSSIDLSEKSIKELGSICKYNYGKFLLEFDKVENYAKKNNISTDDSLNKLLKAGTIYTGNRDVIFEFINRVMSANINMYSSFNVLSLQGESNIKIISLLYTSFRNQFIYQTVSSPNVESTGLNQFTINICKGRSNIYSVEDLRKALRILKNVEQGIKSGLFEESQVIDYFLSELLL